MVDKPRTLVMDGPAMKYMEKNGIKRNGMPEQKLSVMMQILYACSLSHQATEGVISFEKFCDNVFNYREAIAVALELIANRINEGAPYLPSENAVLDKVIEAAKGTETFYDFGCGDGRVLVKASRAGISNVVGYETDGPRAKVAAQILKRANVTGEVRNASFFDLDLSTLGPGSTIYLYLWFDMIPKIAEFFKKLPVGVKIITQDFHLTEWEADEVYRIGNHSLHVVTTKMDDKHKEVTIDLDNMTDADADILAERLLAQFDE
jgi:SAM-dependent methyltransferase